MRRYVLVLLQSDGCLRPGVGAAEIPNVVTDSPVSILMRLHEPLRWWGLN